MIIKPTLLGRKIKHAVIIAGTTSLLLVAGCEKHSSDVYEKHSSDVYMVDTRSDEPLGARLEICDSITPMERMPSGYTITREINCEGSARIVLTYAKGPTVECTIGYVTTGLDPMLWRFNVQDKSCQKPLLSKINNSKGTITN